MKKQIKKLSLNKMTISNLNAVEMNRHVGGAAKAVEINKHVAGEGHALATRACWTRRCHASF